MCRNSDESMDPLVYLRTSLYDMVNHENSTESLQFRGLASDFMFECDQDEEWKFKHRMKLLNELMEFFPDMKNNSRSIIDMVVKYETNL
jgi:hypothetical protein